MIYLGILLLAIIDESLADEMDMCRIEDLVQLRNEIQAAIS